ncbi:glycosyl hydrolase family 32 [Lacunimicrobium album]
MFRLSKISSLYLAAALFALASVSASERPAVSDSGASVRLKGIQPEVDVLKPGVLLFSDRDYRALEIPDSLRDQAFVRGSIERTEFVVTADGKLTVLVPYVKHPATKFQGVTLERAGYVQVPDPDNFQLFGPHDFERVSIYQKNVVKGEKLSLSKFAVLVGIREASVLAAPDWNQNDGERLENGIVLPSTWPPIHLDPKSTEPMPVPYLEHPPKVLPINRGRQLFVDDFLIESTDLVRTFHNAEKYTENPVFHAETAEELASSSIGERGQQAVCYLGHGGVFYDPSEQHFKMFYTAGWRGGLALATSRDLVNWQRPQLNSEGTNILLPKGIQSVGGDNCLWLDLNAKKPDERLKFLTDRGKPGHQVTTSADGLTWSEPVSVGHAGDYCSFFYNPFRKVWAYSVKRDGPRGRSRYYSESREFMKGDWSDSVYWTNADKLDRPEQTGSYPHPGEAPQLYSLNAVAYESLMIGIHYIHRGPNNGLCDQGKFPKLTDLELGFSRDGFHWHRPDRSGFIRGSRQEGAWDRAYLHSTAGVFAVVGDKLVFPYTGYSGSSPSGARGMYTGASVGLATLRRDGFASLDAVEATGTLTTRPVTFEGKHLFVNVSAPNGKLRVAAVDEEGQEIAPFTFENCQEVSGDTTLQAVTWKGATDLTSLHGKPVQFRFELTNGSLYSFWISPDKTGRSEGYVAAGGPGYPGTIDTVGRGALE